MPRFYGYICPRTEALFKDKASYVSHLRELATESRRTKRVQREIDKLRASFDVMRLRATGVRDVTAWLQQKRAEIIRIACLIEPSFEDRRDAAARDRIQAVEAGVVGTESFGEQVQVDGVVTSLPGQTNFSLLAKDIRLNALVSTRTVFVEMIVEVFRKIPGLTAQNLSQGILLRLFAEDWPYIAGRALYQYRDSMEIVHIRCSAARIIERRYPAVSFDQYLALCENGLLLGEDSLWDETSFLHWLEHNHDAAKDLPALETQPHGMFAEGGPACL
jgi:uncharacterized C2H2 Zn-finger protein